jgi:hypothetical protein
MPEMLPPLGLRNRGCRPVDAQHKSGVTDNLENGPLGDAGAATDFQNSHSWAKRQRRYRL